ncbi:MAG TPA: hypothetical protein DD727_08560, partial [Clostridiales bacterium]|nr:hypothetical protein [Clostridiales bacterium]
HNASKNYTKEYTEYTARIGSDTDLRSGEIIFAENFRSSSPLIDFFNCFFHDLLYRDIYEDYDARPQPMVCSGNRRPGGVEILVVDGDGDPSGADASPGKDDCRDCDEIKDPESTLQEPVMSPHFKEALLIVGKIREVFSGEDPQYQRVREYARKGRPAAAILLNRRTMMKTYEEALRIHRIDFTVVRGRGFFQRPEIVDMANLIAFLADPADNEALTAFLRSPVGHISDAGIYLLHRAVSRAGAAEPAGIAERTGAAEPAGIAERTGGELWEKLRAFSRHEGGFAGFTPEDRESLLHACKCLSRWIPLSRRMPLVEFLRHVLDEGGYFLSLCRGSRGDQALSNIEKLLDHARQVSVEEGMELPDFAGWLRDRVEYLEDEGEADLDISLGGAVQLMTVHQSKGLEFPMVFVPDMGAGFNLGERELLHADMVPWQMEIDDGGNGGGNGGNSNGGNGGNGDGNGGNGGNGGNSNGGNSNGGNGGGAAIRRQERLEIGINAPNPDNAWESEPTLVKRIIRRRLKDKLIAERKRLLYVAATRAMDHLVLVGHTRLGAAGVVRRVHYRPLDQLGNWMDWLNKILDLSSGMTKVRGELLYGRASLAADSGALDADNGALDADGRASLSEDHGTAQSTGVTSNIGTGSSIRIPYRKFQFDKSHCGVEPEYRIQFPVV